MYTYIYIHIYVYFYIYIYIHSNLRVDVRQRCKHWPESEPYLLGLELKDIIAGVRLKYKDQEETYLHTQPYLTHFFPNMYSNKWTKLR